MVAPTSQRSQEDEIDQVVNKCCQAYNTNSLTESSTLCISQADKWYIGIYHTRSPTKGESYILLKPKY